MLYFLDAQRSIWSLRETGELTNMTQPSNGQLKQQLLKELEQLEHDGHLVDWMDGYQIKSFLYELINVLKKG